MIMRAVALVGSGKQTSNTTNNLTQRQQAMSGLSLFYSVVLVVVHACVAMSEPGHINQRFVTISVI